MDLTLDDPVALIVRAFDEAAQSALQGWTPGVGQDPPTLARSRLKIQAVLRFGLAALRAIQHLDAGWHTAVFEESIPYRAADHAGIVELYRSWHTATTAVLAGLAPWEQAGTSLDDLDKLRAGQAVVASLLTPDDEFFEGEPLDELAQDALDAHARGETVEIREMGE